METFTKLLSRLAESTLRATVRQQLLALDLLRLARDVRLEVEGRVEGGARAFLDALGIASREDLDELRGAVAVLRAELSGLRAAAQKEPAA